MNIDAGEGVFVAEVMAGQKPHLDEGVHELMEAVKHGKQGHASVGTTHAKKALMQMKEVH